MDLLGELQKTIQNAMGAYGLTDLAVGTVTRTDPLAVKIREGMADVPEAALWLTEAVMEKKIPVLAHGHFTAGFRHSHTLPDLDHSHETGEGPTDGALAGEKRTASALDPDAYSSDTRLENILCYEDGKPLPVKDGYIILNRALETGDKVLLLRVMQGEQFLILSRVFRREA